MSRSYCIYKLQDGGKSRKLPTILKNIGETILDFTPIVGDIKGLTVDPYRAYKEGGWKGALSMAGLGLIGLIPGGDAFKVIKRIPIEAAAQYTKKLKEAGLASDISIEQVQKFLNDRIEKLNKDIATKLEKNERVSISGNRGLSDQNILDTYNKEGNVGTTIVGNGKVNNGIIKIVNTSEEILGHRVPKYTVYGLDAARQFSQSQGKPLVSGKYLLMPEATLKAEQDLLYRNLPQQGNFESRNIKDYLARFHEKPDEKTILRDLNNVEFIAELSHPEYEHIAHSYPEIFNNLPIIRNGKVTYLKDPKNAWVLKYMDDRPGFYQREILGIKEPSKYPHTVYSRFPDTRSFYENVISPNDLPSFVDFGIFKFKKGNKIDENN